MMAATKRVATIVVTHNRKKLLRECIEALLKQSYKHQDILIIDNASTDGTEEAIAKYIDNKRVFYFNTSKNIGGAGGFNYGMREALKRKYNYAWLMDDDSIAKNHNALSSLVKKATFLRGKFSFLSSLVKWTDGKLCKLNMQTLNENWSNSYKYAAKNLLPAKNASFVGFFANMSVVKKAGLPIKEFFIYRDDSEYSLRLEKFAPSYIDLDSILIHKTISNGGPSAADCDVSKIKRIFYHYRNGEYIKRKYVPFRDHFQYQYLYFLNMLSILCFAKNHRIKRMWYYTKGKIAGRFFNPKIEMK